jgi:hypothetical protein
MRLCPSPADLKLSLKKLSASSVKTSRATFQIEKVLGGVLIFAISGMTLTVVIDRYEHKVALDPAGFNQPINKPSGLDELGLMRAPSPIQPLLY